MPPEFTEGRLRSAVVVLGPFFARGSAQSQSDRQTFRISESHVPGKRSAARGQSRACCAVDLVSHSHAPGGRPSKEHSIQYSRIPHILPRAPPLPHSAFTARTSKLVAKVACLDRACGWLHPPGMRFPSEHARSAAVDPSPREEAL